MTTEMRLKQHHLYLTRKDIEGLFKLAANYELDYRDIEEDCRDAFGLSSLMRKAVRLEDELSHMVIGELRVELVNLYGSRITNEDLCYIGGMTVPELEYAIQEMN